MKTMMMSMMQMYMLKNVTRFSIRLSRIECAKAGEIPRLFLYIKIWVSGQENLACKKTTKHHNLKVIEFQLG